LISGTGPLIGGIAVASDRFNRVKEILLRVMDAPRSDRALVLDRECDGDRDLRREVEELLAQEGKLETFRFGATHALETEPDAPLVGRIISHYRIDALLGEGGIGRVYRAEDMVLGRSVALKFLRPNSVGSGESKARFIREARAAAALNHPNICTLHAIEESDGGLFLDMALVEGETLRARIERGALPPEDALGIAVQVASGLEAAHAKGIIHRDVKPSNIMIAADDRVQVLDFGLARLTGYAEVTLSGEILGTAEYMSAEQAQGQPVDARTDVWSLGVVLFEMLTGQRPFDRDSITAVLYAIVNETPPDLRDLDPKLPEALSAILTRALAKRREDRYGEVREFRQDLERIRRHLHRTGSARRPPPRGWRRLLRAVGLGRRLWP
jgi:serine/threonine protein kinase